MEEKIKKLEDLVARKEQEIKDIKFSISNILLQIRNINENESNEYSDPIVKKRIISELCTNTRYKLLVDEMEIKKELTPTDQSNS